MQHSRGARGEPEAQDHLVHLPARQGQARRWLIGHLFTRVPHFFGSGFSLKIAECFTFFLSFFSFFPIRVLYLVLGYLDGFQVWDCSNIEEIHEVLSVREGATRCAKVRFLSSFFYFSFFFLREDDMSSWGSVFGVSS